MKDYEKDEMINQILFKLIDNGLIKTDEYPTPHDAYMMTKDIIKSGIEKKEKEDFIRELELER